MMNLEKMREAMQASRKTATVECPGIGSFTIKQLDAASGMRLANTVSGLSSKKDEAYSDAMFAFFVDMVAKCLVDDSGAAGFDSDEGRSLLSQMRFDQLTILGNACMALNGMSDDQDKKN